MVPADSDRISPVPPYSGYHYANTILPYGAITLYGLPFQVILASFLQSNVVVLQPQHCRNNTGLGSSAFARHYLRNHLLFSFPPGT